MKAYTTLTGISKLNDMVIEGQNQSATFRILIIPTYANRYNPFTVQSLNPDIASVRASGADTYTVTSVGLGTTQILVTNGPISEQFNVTVQRANIAVKKITLSEQNKSMLADDEFTLTAQQWNLPMLQKKLIGVLLHPISWQYPTQTIKLQISLPY